MTWKSGRTGVTDPCLTRSLTIAVYVSSWNGNYQVFYALHLFLAAFAALLSVDCLLLSIPLYQNQHYQWFPDFWGVVLPLYLFDFVTFRSSESAM